MYAGGPESHPREAMAGVPASRILAMSHCVRGPFPESVRIFAPPFLHAGHSGPALAATTPPSPRACTTLPRQLAHALEAPAIAGRRARRLGPLLLPPCFPSPDPDGVHRDLAMHPIRVWAA